MAKRKQDESAGTGPIVDHLLAEDMAVLQSDGAAGAVSYDVLTGGPLPPPAKESARSRFLRLINRRMVRALKALHAVGNLSAKSAYEYTPAEAEKIIMDLSRAVDRVADRFRGTANKVEEWSL